MNDDHDDDDGGRDLFPFRCRSCSHRRSPADNCSFLALHQESEEGEEARDKVLVTHQHVDQTRQARGTAREREVEGLLGLEVEPSRGFLLPLSVLPLLSGLLLRRCNSLAYYETATSLLRAAISVHAPSLSLPFAFFLAILFTLFFPSFRFALALASSLGSCPCRPNGRGGSTLP